MAAAMTREMPRHAFPDFHERGLFDGCDGANETRLREMLRTAEFWIAVLEGEQQEILEESAKQRRESEAALRNAVAGAAAKEQEVRELEGERRRLQEEVQWLQKSRDEALCEKALLRHDGKRVQGDAETISSRAETLEAELRREREEKSELESQLVRTKVRFAEAMELADGMEATIVHYEEQLRALDPSFEPKGRITLGQWRRVAARGHEGDSNASSEQNTPRASASRDAVAPAIAMSQEGSERQGAGGSGEKHGSKSGWKAAVSKLGRNFRKQRRTSVEESVAAGAGGEPPASEEPAAECAVDEDVAPRSRRRWEMRVEE